MKKTITLVEIYYKMIPNLAQDILILNAVL